MDSEWAARFLREIAEDRAHRARVTKVQWLAGVMAWERMTKPTERWDEQMGGVVVSRPLWTTVRAWQHRKLARAIYLPEVAGG
jgi:hypothetical protein